MRHSKKNYRIFLQNLKKYYCELYEEYCEEINGFVKEIWRDREEKQTYNDWFHTSLIVSAAVGLLRFFEEKKIEKRIKKYQVSVECKIGLINPDVFSTFSGKMKGSLIMEVENPYIPDRFILSDYELYYLGRLTTKTLRYSPLVSNFYVVYPYRMHPDKEILEKYFLIFEEKNEDQIKKIAEYYYNVTHPNGKNNDCRLISNIPSAHADGIIFTDKGNLYFKDGLVKKQIGK